MSDLSVKNQQALDALRSAVIEPDGHESAERQEVVHGDGNR